MLILAIGGGAYFFLKQRGQVLGQSSNLGEYLEENFPAANQFIQKLPFTNQVLNSQTTNQDSQTRAASNNTDNQQIATFFQNSLDLTGQQLTTLGDNANKVKDQLFDFTSQIKESSQSTPLHERALEYGQYLYCQQIIKQYEAVASPQP